MAKLPDGFSGKATRAAIAGILAASAAAGLSSHKPAQAQAQIPQAGLVSLCRPETMAAVAAGLNPAVTIKEVPNGPKLPGGVKLIPAAGRVPAYCQVTGSYVTNPKTGKTANFLATLPERWNGKYLQLGCSGSCGFLLMNDPAAPPIVVTAQGYPGQMMEKGYAVFGNDLGHVSAGPGVDFYGWIRNPEGGLNLDALEDYYYRADLVMADMGKAFTTAFYSRQSGAAVSIAWSYFNGCSQGGREALIAATRFPEKFDGIIAGSPFADPPATLFHLTARGILNQQSHPAKLTPGQVAMLNERVAGKCDALDGVKDGLIQNPAACEFRPARDLPICAPGQTGDGCVTRAQAESISTFLSGLTDEGGHLLQPGGPVAHSEYGYVPAPPISTPLDGDIRFLIGKDFDGQALVTGRSGGPGSIGAYHVVANGPAYRKFIEVQRTGTVLPEDFAALLKRDGKLLWYHNLSDESLTPYMSINRYKRLAELHGGYARLQRNVRLFGLPGTGHCATTGSGPSNFDALGALEGWVEQNKAPNAILARTIEPGFGVMAGTIDWSKPALRTMPLCMFPQMARYKGMGDVKDAANWECRAADTRMLTIGNAGREAGVRR